MKFTEIIDIIDKGHTIQILSSAPDTDISGVKLWDGSAPDSSGSTLFFSYDSQMPARPQNCIIAGCPEDISEPAAGNLAVIPPEHFASVFNSIQDVLSVQSKDSFHHYIMDVADNVRSVEALIDVASQSFNASLVLIDRDFRILGYSTQVPVTDPLWAENIRKGYCDYEFISEVKKLKSVQLADAGIKPFEVTCSSSPFRKLACRVYCRDAWIASLLLIEGDNTYRTEHIDMLRILSGVTGYSMLAHSPELLSRTSEYHRFLYNLIIGTPLESLPETYRQLKFQENMKVMFFKPDSSRESLIKGSVIREAFHKELPECHVITHRKAAVVVCNLEDAGKAEQLLGLFPPDSGVRVGVSSIFHRIETLRDALNEAQDALAVGSELDPDKRVFPFEDYSSFIMLRHLSEHEKITRYYHRAIPYLTEYDEVNGTKMLDTLRSYLSNSCSIKETSEALFLHRNSVIYRLKKIEELCGIDLDDPDVRFSLRLSFHILRIAEAN